MPSALRAVLATFAIALISAAPALAAPSVPEMATEIAPGPSGSHPYSMMPYKNGLLFFANDGKRGFELWRYDGDVAQLVADK